LPTDAILAALARLTAEVAALREDVAALAPERPDPLPSDRERALRLLPAALQAVRSASFTVKSLREHGELTRNASLIAALDEIGTARSVGRLLRRISGADIGGIKVLAVGAGEDGAIWVIQSFETQKTQPVG
jgi:hypothetical protein